MCKHLLHKRFGGPCGEGAHVLEIARRKSRYVLFDPLPVVKLVTPNAGATWLLMEIDPDTREIAVGLCDPGIGCPEVGHVSRAELLELRGMLNLPSEQDLQFRATQRLSEYAKEARTAGRITGPRAAPPALPAAPT